MKSAKKVLDAPEYGKLLGEFDKAESAYKQAKVNELAAKHALKTAAKDASKTEEHVLRLKLDQAKHIRKACKAAVRIAKTAIKQWTKLTISHIVLEKPDAKKRGRQAKSAEKTVEKVRKAVETPVKMVVETPTEAPAPKKRGRQPKVAEMVVEKSVEASVEVAAVVAEVEAPQPKKRGRQPKALILEEEEEGVAGASARLMEEAPVVEKAVKAPKAPKEPKAEKAVKAPKAEKVEKPAKEPKAPKAEKAEKAPKVAVVAPTLLGEDFSIIEGIGPKSTSVLHENGILTFKELATRGYDELKALMLNNRQYFANPTNWMRQAQLAADGKMAELEALKAELKNGK